MKRVVRCRYICSPGTCNRFQRAICPSDATPCARTARTWHTYPPTLFIVLRSIFFHLFSILTAAGSFVFDLVKFSNKKGLFSVRGKTFGTRRVRNRYHNIDNNKSEKKRTKKKFFFRVFL